MSPGWRSASPDQALPFSSVPCHFRLSRFLRAGERLGLVIWKNALRLQVTTSPSCSIERAMPGLRQCLPGRGRANPQVGPFLCQPMTAHQAHSDDGPKKILGKPVGCNPDSCTGNNNIKCKQTTFGYQRVKINLAFSFVVLTRNVPKNLLFLRSNLLLPSVLLIWLEEVLFVFCNSLDYCGYSLNWIQPRMQGRIGCKTDLISLAPKLKNL